jgi:cytochrome c peroxidase
MHDGRFKTLKEVIEHYDSGVKNHPGLHWSLQEGFGNPKRLGLSRVEKEALIAFYIH